jgi:uncharacterized protein (DUF433 family)
MQLEDYFEFEKFSTKFGEVERIRIKGHRVSVEHLIAPFKEGLSPERIWQSLPTLSLEEVYATITYYLHNKDELERYLLQGERIADAYYQEYLQNLPPAVQRLRAIKAQQQQAVQGKP